MPQFSVLDPLCDSSLSLKTKLAIMQERFPALSKRRGKKGQRSKDHEQIWSCSLLDGPTALTANGAGLALFFVNNSPANTYDWTTYVGLFSEYRTVSVSTTFHPLQVVNTATSFSNFFGTSIDDNAATAGAAPASAAEVYGHTDTLIDHEPYGLVHHRWECLKDASNPDDTWNLTSAPATTGAIKGCYSSTIVTATVGYVVDRYEVQFRGLKG